MVNGVDMEKVTYASPATTLNEETHRLFDLALTQERKKLGHTHPLFINGHPVKAHALSDHAAPWDTRVLIGRFPRASREQVRKAITAAKIAFAYWQDLGWQNRVAFVRKTADVISKRQFELAALISLEVGKTRLEAMAEVSEAVDLILYYCRQMEERQGYENSMSVAGTERTRSVLKPYGVWAVIAPFHSPLASATGMMAAAMVAGNTVVFKPESDTPTVGLRLYEMFHQAGLPVGVCNSLTGLAPEIIREFVLNPDIDGFAFGGSTDAGMELMNEIKAARPFIAQMGGKNPAIVMPSANLDDAAEGVLRSAFGLAGQNPAGCSRAYVHEKVSKPLSELIAEKAKRLAPGDPTNRETTLGPLINAAAVARYEQAIRLAKKEGRIVCGGRKLKGENFEHGFYVEPTVVDDLPKESRLFRDESFGPVLAIGQVGSLDEALTLANASACGLSAGIFTTNESEQEAFFERMQAGALFCNRRAGATTGAWPGVQSFGGWKGAGSAGKNALGPYYVPLFMREQSQTVTRLHATVQPTARADYRPDAFTPQRAASALW
jgi:1-pyrroline-5-carboxylate dehydrogenase